MLATVVATILVTVVGLAALSSGGSQADDPPAAGSTEGPANRSPSGTPPGDGGADEGAGSEVSRQPESSPTQGLPGLRPTKAPQTGSLVAVPLPRTATRRGAVVAGFPLSVIPVLTGAAVRSTAVSSASDVLQVSIEARTRQAPESVLAFYRTALSAQGFSESTVPAVDGSTGSAFSRGVDHLVVTVARPAGHDTKYSVYGALHPRAND